jgi:hypothetical protein
MYCQYPGCPNPAQPELPLCEAHAPQLVFGFTLPPYQVLVLGPGTGLESFVTAGPAPDSEPLGADDAPADQPAESVHDSDLYGGGHHQPPWNQHPASPPWEENGNGHGQHE